MDDGWRWMAKGGAGNFRENSPAKRKQLKGHKPTMSVAKVAPSTLIKQIQLEDSIKESAEEDIFPGIGKMFKCFTRNKSLYPYNNACRACVLQRNNNKTAVQVDWAPPFALWLRCAKFTDLMRVGAVKGLKSRSPSLTTVLRWNVSSSKWSSKTSPLIWYWCISAIFFPPLPGTVVTSIPLQFSCKARISLKFLVFPAERWYISIFAHFWRDTWETCFYNEDISLWILYRSRGGELHQCRRQRHAA